MILQIIKIRKKGKINKRQIPRKIANRLVKMGLIYLRKGMYWYNNNNTVIAFEAEYYYITSKGSSWRFRKNLKAKAEFKLKKPHHKNKNA